MSEFEVTEGMLDDAASQLPPAADWALKAAIERALAHEDFQRQLRAYVAEQMRGLVPEQLRESEETSGAYVWNTCRAETLANIAKWESSNGQ